MCDPVTMAVVAIGQAVVGYQAANANYKAQLKAYEQNAENATRATATNYSNLNIRLQQEDQAAAQSKQQNEIEAAKAASSAEVAAAAGGVGGLSVGAVLQDIYAQAGRNEATTDANLRMTRGYLQGELKSAEQSGQNAINSMPIPEKPGFLPFALGAFSSGLNAYNDNLKRKNN